MPILRQENAQHAESCTTVGIDDISVYIPRLFVPTAGEFASSRGIDPLKLTQGIGIERMAIPDAHEDAATMAAMSLLDLMRRNDLAPDQIGRIYIGTESAVDEAKAMGTYVIGMLEDIYGEGAFRECSTVEMKSACIATAMALESLSYWASAEDRVGIAIASDIARYPLRSPGEYTQGAGSVALLVKRSPRLIALEQVYGSYTRDENDFFRPIGCSTAVVDGKHSNQCYLDAVREAFLSYSRAAQRRGIIELEEGECVSDQIDWLLFHIPYPRMVEYASAEILREEWRGLPRWRRVLEETGPEAEEREFVRRFSRSRPFLEAFGSKVRETALISRQVGNIYTGSIFLGLASLIEAHRLSPGERLCFAAYGSGCSALVFSGIVQREGKTLLPLGVLERLGMRRMISVEEYERLHEGRAEKSIIDPCQEFALEGIDGKGYRHYCYVG